ncbi:MAG: hypothetical protein ACYDCQ_20005 [Dehalococcoidia bacterium]
MVRRHPAPPGRHTVRCAMCRVQLNPRTGPVRLDGRYLCASCQGMAHLLDGAVAREAASHDSAEG